MKPKKQIVYHPVRVEDELPDKNYSDELHLDMNFKSYEEAELACLRKLIELAKTKDHEI